MTLLGVIYSFIVFFLIAIVLLWFLILKYINSNKIKEKQYLRLEENLIEGIVSSYSEDSNELALKKLQHTSQYLEKNYIEFRDVAYVFIKVNRVFKFSNNSNFKKLYSHLGLDNKIRYKLDANDWYAKAKAILLSYELGLNENTLTISAYKDDKNTLVKREAQIALVTFLGWKSFIFFPYVTRPISLWQQIRIIEKLHETQHVFDSDAFEKALKAENPIIKELLVRIIKNFKLYNYRNYIKTQLNSKNKQLVKIAQETLTQLDLEKQELEQIEVRLPNIKKKELIKNAISSSN